MEEKVLEHQLDGAFVTETDFSPDIEAYEVFEEELVLIAGPNSDSIETIQSEPVLCFSKGCGYRARLEKWYADQHIIPKKIIEFGTLETILRSVTVGLGIAFVPKSSVTHLEESGLIVSYPLPDEYSKVKTMFIKRTDTFMTTTLKKFIETIEANKNLQIHSLKY